MVRALWYYPKLLSHLDFLPIQTELLLCPQNILFLPSNFCSCYSLHSGLCLFVPSSQSIHPLRLSSKAMTSNSTVSAPIWSFSYICSLSRCKLSFPFPWHFLGVFMKSLILSLTWVSHEYYLTAYGLHVGSKSTVSPSSLTAVPCRCWALCPCWERNKSCWVKSK